jgi:hypothetical protein
LTLRPLMDVIRYQPLPVAERPAHRVLQRPPDTLAVATTFVPARIRSLIVALVVGRVRRLTPSHRAASVVAPRAGPGIAASSATRTSATMVATARRERGLRAAGWGMGTSARADH